jgi:hypothetical protein
MIKAWILSHLNTLFIATIAVISPVKPLLLTVGFLIVADFIFGIYRAYRLKENITSRKMGNTISKIILYNLAILSVYFLDKNILDTGLHLEKICAGLIGVVEIKSLSESFYILTGIDIWTKLKGILERGESNTKDLLDDDGTDKIA